MGGARLTERDSRRLSIEGGELRQRKTMTCNDYTLALEIKVDFEGLSRKVCKQ